MQIATLSDCFDSHLTDLSIVDESQEGFIIAVVERYLINLGGHGFTFSSHAEDTFNELCIEVKEMLTIKTYGHVSLNSYRDHLRLRAVS